MVAKRDPATKGKEARLSATKKLFMSFTTLKDLVPIKIRPEKYIKTIAISIYHPMDQAKSIFFTPQCQITGRISPL